MNRREFIFNATAVAVASAIQPKTILATATSNLIPEVATGAPNYWCTWAVQNYMYGHHLGELHPETLEGDAGSKLAHEAMNEQVLLGEKGWAHEFYSRVRKDLFLLLDDGWEAGGTATFELNTEKFPSFSGNRSQRLSKLNDAIRSAGWRGAALWCRNTPGGRQDGELETLSNQANIHYWKIDIGDPEFHLVDLRKENHLPLQFEHVHGEGPLNGDWSKDGRFGPQPWGSRRQQILAHTDVYRTYDVTAILSLPTTLDRVAEMLKGAQGHSDARALLNVEDEVYVAATLGCTMGILRHPLTGLRPGADVDLFFNGPRQTKRRMDEVVRALRWQRIAPPFPAGAASLEISDEILTDSWTFARGETWDSNMVGHTAHQSAPACIARNMRLPRITAAGDKPFVFAAKFPNGAVAIGIQERTRTDRGWHLPPADVEIHVGDSPGPFGIFGNCRNLTLVFDEPLKGKRVHMQDLLSENAQEATAQVRIDGKKLILSEAILRKFGASHATPGDLSSPGLVLIFE